MSLRDEPWIAGEAQSENEPIFAAWPMLSAPRFASSGRDWPSRLGIVAAGLGIAVLPNLATAAVPAAVAVIDVEDPAHKEPSALALAPLDATEAARATVGALRSEAARIALSTAAGEQQRGRAGAPWHLRRSTTGAFAVAPSRVHARCRGAISD